MSAVYEVAPTLASITKWCKLDTSHVSLAASLLVVALAYITCQQRCIIFIYHDDNFHSNLFLFVFLLSNGIQTDSAGWLVVLLPSITKRP